MTIYHSALSLFCKENSFSTPSYPLRIILGRNFASRSADACMLHRTPPTSTPHHHCIPLMPPLRRRPLFPRPHRCRRLPGSRCPIPDLARYLSTSAPQPGLAKARGPDARQHATVAAFSSRSVLVCLARCIASNPVYCVLRAI